MVFQKMIIISENKRNKKVQTFVATTKGTGIWWIYNCGVNGDCVLLRLTPSLVTVVRLAGRLNLSLIIVFIRPPIRML